MWYKKKCILFVVLFLYLFIILSSNLTYSKFTYSKEIGGNIITQKEITFVDTLIDSARNNLDTNVNFGEAPSSTNGTGLMMREGTQNNTYPIVYYRGNVRNNFVIFAGYCWQIVRTTETGGIKLVYYGIAVDDEWCHYYPDVLINDDVTTSFNQLYNSPVYGGYMYNDSNNFLESMDIDVDGYKAHLADNTVDSETGRHVQNLKDSTIKGVVDDWYEANILGKPEERLLEDTVWCNDRSVISETYSIENYKTNMLWFTFAAYTRLYENTTKTPSLTCNRDMDKFTVEEEIGNGDLDYPIGLLTADEILMAGSIGERNYLFLGIELDINFWTISPATFSDERSHMFIVYNDGDYINDVLSSNFSVYGEHGVRPALALNKNVKVKQGNGTTDTPYIVE